MRLLTILVVLIAGIFFAVSASDACSYYFPVWTLRAKSADPLFRFEQNGKAGYIDVTGKIVVKPTIALFDDSNFYGEFHEGVTAFYEDGRYRYMDRSGSILFRADGLGLEFAEGLAAASRQIGRDTEWGFLDHSGKFAIEPRFHRTNSFSEGLAAVATTPSPGTTGFIDHTGGFVIQPNLSHASDFHEDRALVIGGGPCQFVSHDSCGFVSEYRPTQPNATYDCRYSFIDKTGAPISDLRVDDAHDFSEGLAAVKVGAKWGYVDKPGQFAIQPAFESAGQFSEGLAAVSHGEKFGFINRSGQLVIPTQFRFVSSFSDQRALVMDVDEKRGTTYRFINHSGKSAFPGTFAVATSFMHGLAAVSSDYRRGHGTVSWIDNTGKAVFTYKH